MQVSSFDDHIKSENKIRFGQEAILNLREISFNKKSLMQLIKRGNKNGNCCEIIYSEANSRKLNYFFKQTVHAGEPQLKGFFDTEFLKRHRLFVIKNDQDKWYGAILLTVKNTKLVQTELLLRMKHSPACVMESLIFFIYNKLKEEGFEKWSLGAVPFVGKSSFYRLKEYLLIRTGRLLNFAYNYNGLYFFKNKFNPEWNDCYLLSNRRISYASILKIAVQSNLLSLIVYKFVISFQNIFS